MDTSGIARRSPSIGRRPAVFGLAACALLLAFTPSLRAEELTAEQEAAIMEEEAAAEEKLPMDQAPPPELTGRVHLNADATDEKDAVVGVFVVKERAYQLRLGQTGVLAKLKSNDGKTVTLVGKVRMRGKYFIVEELDTPVPGPAAVDRARRMSM